MDFVADSLAVVYLRIGLFSVVNNLLTWIAVITAAAFSLWKLRNPSFCSVPAVSSLRSVEPIEDAAPDERRATSAETSSSAPATTATDAMMVCGATKGKKMTVFFGDYSEDEAEVKEEGGDDDEAATEGVAGEWWWSGWERVMRVRRGEREWYSCQDVTFINGNVVRLWDDVRARWSPLR